MGLLLRNWITESIAEMTLTKEATAYLIKRGAQVCSFEALGHVVWSLPNKACPDVSFCEKYGERGERFQGHIISPYFSPRGHILGFEARTPDKSIFDVRTPDAKWNPVWIGLLPDNMNKIWNGCSVWVVEGVFDLFPLERVIPSSDVILASVHASLSRNHVNFLKRFCRGQVSVVFDMDPPGKRGAKKAMEYLSRVGVTFRNVEYKGGKDPGVVWETYGINGMHKAFRNFLGR